MTERSDDPAKLGIVHSPMVVVAAVSACYRTLSWSTAMLKIGRRMVAA